MKPPVAFMSYSHRDDEHDKQRLTQFRERLEGEVRAQTGEEFEIFQDRVGLRWGQTWKERIDELLLDEITFLIPILTPNFFNSPDCRDEVQLFLARERKLNRSDLILPVYYISDPRFDDDGQRANDALMEELHAHHYVDWRKLRHTSLDSVAARKKREEMARQIRDALNGESGSGDNGPTNKPFKAVRRSSAPTSGLQQDKQADEQTSDEDQAEPQQGDTLPTSDEDQTEPRPGATPDRGRGEQGIPPFIKWYWGVLIAGIVISVLAGLIVNYGLWRLLLVIVTLSVSGTLWVLRSYIKASHPSSSGSVRLAAVVSLLIAASARFHVDSLFHLGTPRATTGRTPIVHPTNTLTATPHSTSTPAIQLTADSTATQSPITVTPAPTRHSTTAPATRPAATSTVQRGTVAPNDAPIPLETLQLRQTNGSNGGVEAIGQGNEARYHGQTIRQGLQLVNSSSDTFGASTMENVIDLGRNHTYLSGVMYIDDATTGNESPTISLYDLGNDDPSSASADTMKQQGRLLLSYNFGHTSASQYPFSIDVHKVRWLGITLDNPGTVDITGTLHTAPYHGTCPATPPSPLGCLSLSYSSNSSSTSYTANVIPPGNLAIFNGTPITNGVQLSNNPPDSFDTGTAFGVFDLGGKYSYLSAVVYADDVMTTTNDAPTIRFYSISRHALSSVDANTIEQQGKVRFTHTFNESDPQSDIECYFSMDVRHISLLGITLDNTGTVDITGMLSLSQRAPKPKSIPPCS